MRSLMRCYRLLRMESRTEGGGAIDKAITLLRWTSLGGKVGGIERGPAAEVGASVAMLGGW